MIRRILVASALATVTLGATAAAYATFTGGGPSPDPFVAGGGRFGPATSTTGFVLSSARDFSVDAHIERKGAKVYGVVRYGRNDAAGESSVRFDISCAALEGSRAVVGGIVRDSDPVEGWVMFLVDAGAPGGPEDQASFVFVDPLDAAVWPEGFPAVCPPATSGIDAFGTGFFDIHAGDVQVSPGGS